MRHYYQKEFTMSDPIVEAHIEAAAEAALDRTIRIPTTALIAVSGLALYGAQDLTRKTVGKVQQIRENRGGSGLAAQWFPINILVKVKYLKIAGMLLNELKDVHHSQREIYLAKRLEEIFG